MPRTKQKLRLAPKVRGFRVSVPHTAQRLILDLPIVRDHMLAERHLMIVQSARVLKEHGISHRRAAAALGVAVSTLSLLIQRFERHGFDGLLPKRFGPKPARRNQPRPCRLYLTLTR